MTQWYWLIGAFLAAWTFLNILSRERQARIQAFDSRIAAAIAAQQAELTKQAAAKESIIVVR